MNASSMKVLVTGAAGFIGFHVAKQLLLRGDEVVGFDVVNDYYDPALKEARLAQLQALPGFQFERANLADGDAVIWMLRRSSVRPGHPSRCAGRCALQP